MADSILRISGVICEEKPLDNIYFGEDVVDYTNLKMVTDFLDANKDAKKITYEINSIGGSVDVGFQMHDALVASGKELECIITGNCYSIATIVSLAAPKEKRKIYENGQYCIHNPFIPEYTLADAYDADDLLSLATEMRAVEDKIANFYVSKTDKSFDEIKELMKADRIIQSAEALELGFVGEIIKTTSAQASLAKGITFFNSKVKLKNNKMATIEGILSAINKLGEKIEAKLKPAVKNYVFTNAEGATLFETEKETDEIMVGDAATPDGTYTLPDGRTVVVTGGKIESISEPVDELENLKKENENLKAELETLKTAGNTKDAELTELKNLLKENSEILAQAKSLISTGKTLARTQTATAEGNKKEPSVKEVKQSAEERRKQLEQAKNKSKK